MRNALSYQASLFVPMAALLWLVGCGPTSSSTDSAPGTDATVGTDASDSGVMTATAVGTFSANATYAVAGGATATLVYVPSDPSADFSLEIRDWTFFENIPTADVKIYLGVGTAFIPAAPLTVNLVGNPPDMIPAADPALPAMTVAPDGAAVLTVPASYGYVPFIDFDSLVVYCMTFGITVSSAILM